MFKFIRNSSFFLLKLYVTLDKAFIKNTGKSNN